jgi:RNA polymerase sigma-70 factor (ECF subfamily)
MATATTLSQGVLDARILSSSSPILGGWWGRVFGIDSALAENSITKHEIDDAAWIAKVRAGDEDAARALIQRLYPTVIKLVRCRLPRRTSEEDLAQTVFAKIFGKLDQFSGRVPLEHWVSRIVVNTCFNELRYEMVRPELRMSDLNRAEEAVVEQLVANDDTLPDSCNKAAR